MAELSNEFIIQKTLVIGLRLSILEKNLSNVTSNCEGGRRIVLGEKITI